MKSLEHTLDAKRGKGAKLLVTYITGGLGDQWIEVLQAVVDAGADAVEVGIPFSDPMIDGPIIQEASQRALDAGATPMSVFGALSCLELEVPTAVMTYYNLIHHAGEERFAQWMNDASVSGAIFPDLSFEEGGSWRRIAKEWGIETVQLVAPSTSDERATLLCEESRGFVYAVGVMGTTGERDRLQTSALEISNRLKLITNKTVLVGIGVSNSEQARAASEVADGVVVGSALVRRVLEGEGPRGAYNFVTDLRKAIDS